MSGRLMAINKCPGVRPIGIGESWKRLFTKANLEVTGEAAKEACGDLQLCAGIEGVIHGVHKNGMQ